MQVGIDEICMCTNFGWRGLLGFGDIATFKNGQFSCLDHGHQKIESAQKFMEVDDENLFHHCLR